MKRCLPFVLCLFAVACACDPEVQNTPTPVANQPAPVKNDPLPNWSGPPLEVKSLANRGLELELMAPTAGHTFEVCAVDTRGAVAEVHLLHRTPGDAFVAQVLTPLRVTIPAERFGGARRVQVWIGTLHGPAGTKPLQEALALELVR